MEAIPWGLGGCGFASKQEWIYIYIYTVTTFEYVEGGPDREAPEVV